jgi:tetratricopeptide (TPR) repeat protein
MKRAIIVLAMACVVGCAGNQKKQPTQKEVATRQWNAARAGVMAGLARDQYENGNIEKARQTTAEALRMDPTNPQLHLLAAKLAIESGQLESADAEVKRARELDPKNAEADYLAGIVYQRWQRLQSAAEAYASAAAKNPLELSYILAQAEMLVALDRSPDALALLQSKADAFEHSAVLRDAIGQLLVQQNRIAEAVDSLHQATTLATDDTGIREHYASALFKAKRYSDASECLSRILRDEKFANRADLLVMLGDCQSQLNHFRDARASYESATRAAPAQSAAWLSLARVALELNDLERADLALRKAVAIDPGAPQAHLLVGYVRLHENKLPDALAAFKKSSALDPKDPTAMSMIGYVLEKQGKSAAAVPFYTKALQLSPHDELATKLMAGVDLRE